MRSEQSSISEKTEKQYTSPRFTIYGNMEQITAGFGGPRGGFGRPHPRCRHRRRHYYDCSTGS